jgi:putative intracellular protease/amidase
MHAKNTYPEVMYHYSLGIPVASICSKPVVLPSSGELPTTIPGQCHHTRVVETNQVTQHPVD